HITLVPHSWAGKKATTKTISETFKMLGDYIPSGTFIVSMDEKHMPSVNYGHILVLENPKEVLKNLYGFDAVDISEECAEYLLGECAEHEMEPMELLLDRFGGKEHLLAGKAPLRLFELTNDKLWDAYLLMLKIKLNRNSYLYQVIQNAATSDGFLKCYVEDTARSLLGSERTLEYAEERADVLKGKGDIEPIIAKFAADTEDDDRAIWFLNCGTDSEMKSLIRRAKKLNVHTDCRLYIKQWLLC
ncbi:MAG: hypothetical protein LIO40_04145, partial [Ruminococcus sp.]|nr:hypothetical protein [Ruminococcus sp.]